MNYKRHYNLLIAKAKRRGLNKAKLKGYHESHHVLPRCLGGGNKRSNLVLLTACEHFVAHRLLSLLNPRHNGLLFAVASFCLMPKVRRLSSRQIAIAQKALLNARARDRQKLYEL